LGLQIAFGVFRPKPQVSTFGASDRLRRLSPQTPGFNLDLAKKFKFDILVHHR
jgi:hypothetical protein